MTETPVYLLCATSLICVLPEGENVLELDGVSRDRCTGVCGLLPIGAPSTLSTSGLKWNLEEQELKFGALVSSSNQIDASVVRVLTSEQIIWTMDIVAQFESEERERKKNEV